MAAETIAKSITFEKDFLAEIEKWANSPEEKRTLSNAVQVLCLVGLEQKKKEKNVQD